MTNGAIGVGTDRAGGLLAGMRIRKKLVFLHTCFSLVLAGVLWLALRPAIGEVIRQAEEHEAKVLLSIVMTERATGGAAADRLLDSLGESVLVVEGDARRLGLTEAQAQEAQRARGATVLRPGQPPLVVAFDPRTETYLGLSVRLEGARGAVLRLYLLMTLALLGVYALVAAALEIFVLPQHVYRPIRTMLAADRAVQEGRKEEEIIPVARIPADELGEIMRSRNGTVSALRRHEADLAAALSRLEEVAGDLKKKNHLLEMAKQNLADADRLASLGMMSAGIAHELNTPLAVLKGLVEKLNRSMQRGGRDGEDGGRTARSPDLTAGEAALMLRVVGRLERLSESLLDFARARAHAAARTPLRPIVEEAWTLVSLDREARSVRMENRLPEGLCALCDGDRIVQVFVNLLRNAVDAMDGGAACPGGEGLIVVGGQSVEREGRPWAALTVTDNGPGISAELLGRLFQPFASTRLDARGTGLGLAVAEGIVREHGGVILARNRTDASGAIFEIVLPDAETAAARLRDDLAVREANGTARLPVDSEPAARPEQTP